MIVSYVLDPLGGADVILMTGVDAWNLSVEYVECGGAAGDHRPDDIDDYNWRIRTRLLAELLEARRATSERWLELFDESAIPTGPGLAGR